MQHVLAVATNKTCMNYPLRSWRFSSDKGVTITLQLSWLISILCFVLKTLRVGSLSGWWCCHLWHSAWLWDLYTSPKTFKFTKNIRIWIHGDRTHTLSLTGLWQFVSDRRPYAWFFDDNCRVRTPWSAIPWPGSVKACKIWCHQCDVAIGYYRTFNRIVDCWCILFSVALQ